MKRLTPTVLWSIIVFAAILGGAGNWLGRTDPTHPALPGLSVTRDLLNTLGYAFTLMLCRRVAADYQPRSRMWLAWVLFAGSCAASIVRHLAEAFIVAAGIARTTSAPLIGLRQIPIVLALLLLIAGLIAMWSSFTALGFDLRFRRGDLPMIAIVAVLVLAIFSARSGMNEAGSIYPSIRFLQYNSALLLGVPALIGMALYRVSDEMGGGALALSLRYMVAFLFIRLVAMAISIHPIFADLTALRVLASAAMLPAVWFFTLAAQNAWQMTVSAQNLAERYDADPIAELAELAQLAGCAK